MRKPTKDEEIQAWQRLAWHMDMHRKITMNEREVIAGLNRMSAWVGAHSDHNGERPESEIQKNVNEAFWKHIAQKSPPDLPKRGRPPKASPEE